MLSEIIHIMEYTLYIYLSVSVGYIVLFSAASHFFKQKKYPATTVRQRFIILVPAYKEDAVIHACVTSVLRQTYPAELYDLIVISDHMRPETNASLRKERIGLIELHEKESSKAKALRIAAETITDQPYDYVLILDADNLISPCYLQELNKAVSQGIKAIQTHRKAKNMNTDIALLDAAIEEMNNSIFRKGHIRLGFSSALTGSGMAFDFRWFVRNIIHTHSTGEDKELGGLIGVATAKKDGLMPMEQFFDRDVNPIEDYNTFTWNGIRKTTKSTSNSPFESGDGQNAVIFIGTNDVQKIGFQATYSGQLIKIRLYWVGSWGKWQTFSLT